MILFLKSFFQPLNLYISKLLYELHYPNLSLFSGCKRTTLFLFHNSFLMFFWFIFLSRFIPLKIKISNLFMNVRYQQLIPFLAAANILPFFVFTITFFHLFLIIFLRLFYWLILNSLQPYFFWSRCILNAILWLLSINPYPFTPWFYNKIQRFGDHAPVLMLLNMLIIYRCISFLMLVGSKASTLDGNWHLYIR